MDEGNFNIVMREFYRFKQKLISKIKGNIDNNKLLSWEDCYIINENWNNKLEKCFIQYKAIEEQNKLNTLLEYNLSINEVPEIIANFTKIISHINSNNKFKLFSKSLLEYLYSKNDLKNCNYAKYFTGNNKIIIEFQRKDEDKALLLIDPLGKDDIKKKSFIIIKNDKDVGGKALLYKDLFNLENIEEIYINYMNNVIPLEKYNNIKQKNLNNNNNFKRDILKILIYIFYYEKSSNKKDNIFNQYLQYYLINLEWLKAFKEFYNYQQLFTLLNKDKRYNYLKFYQSQQIENIIKEFINNNIFNINNILNEDLVNVSNIKASLVNIGKDLTNIYVIHSKIIDIIKPYLFKNEEISFKPIKLFIKENKKYFYNNYNIIIGNINENHIFIPEIILSYKNLLIFDNEKKRFEQNTIKEYIKYRNSRLNDGYKQVLTNENKEKIGQLIKLTNKNNSIDYKKKIQNELMKKRVYSAKQIKLNKNKKNKDKNIKSFESKSNIENSTSKSNNKNSNSNSKEKKANHSKGKIPINKYINKTGNITHYQNNIHTNGIVKDLQNKSKMKNEKNFKELINYNKENNLNILNNSKQKEKDLEKKNNLLIEKNEK